MPPEHSTPVKQSLLSHSTLVTRLAAISGVINILMLSGSLFMMQVYDRVLGSQSVATLISLTAVVGLAYTFQGFLDLARSRVLTLVGESLEEEVSPLLYRLVIEMPLRLKKAGREALQPFRDIEAIRGFLSGPGPLALLDIPWLPIYLGIAFLMHPYLGLLTMAAAGVMLFLTYLTEVRSRDVSKLATNAQSVRNMHTEAALQGAEVVFAMGMIPALTARWEAAHHNYLTEQRKTNFVTGHSSTLSKTFRQMLQSANLALGAYLAIKGEISSGSIIAISILSSRALAPIEQAIASWKAFTAARAGYARLNQLFDAMPNTRQRFNLPRPCRDLTVEAVFVGPPGSETPIIQGVNFRVEAGEAVGVIGPSASGKSSLVRALVGVWTPMRGKVMLDGASLSQWPNEELGAHIGFLPQDVQLFDGTIAENIARFLPDAPAPEVIKAAEAAGFHEGILQFPKGYHTPVGSAGTALSAGQRQRLGLARALFGDPFLVVLDEPNANLDVEGENAVASAIWSIRQRGGIAVVVAHRPSALNAVDYLLVMKQGQMVAFGPKDQILGRPQPFQGDQLPQYGQERVDRNRTLSIPRPRGERP